MINVKWLIMKRLLFFVVFVFSSIRLFAIAESPERLFYKGKEFSFYAWPLESYFKKFPTKLPESPYRNCNLSRGYLGTYQILEGYLVLKNIEIEVDTGMQSVLKQIFLKKKALRIDWFSKLLIIPYGEDFDYQEETLESKFSNYLILQFENGKLQKEYDLKRKEFEEFRLQQFMLFKKTKKYEELKADHIERARSKIQYRNSDEFKSSKFYKEEQESGYVWVDPYSKHPIDDYIILDMFDNLEKLLSE